MTVSPKTDLTAWYLDEEAEMGLGRVQRAIIRLLTDCLRMLAEERGWSDYVIDGDQYIAWMPEDPNVRVSPDIYLLWNPPEDPWVDSWQTWRPDHPVPAFALEVVSYDWRKDYILAPEKFGSLGVDELVVFDPWPEKRPRGRGVSFQLWRRGASGDLEPQEVEELGVWSVTFGAYIVAVDTPDKVRLRVARSLDPLDLEPTPEERSMASRQRLEALLREHGIDPEG